MKTTIISILFFISVSLSAQIQNPNYANNREPLLKTKYVKLPLGAVKPQGWLRDQLVVQANGLTGHLNEVWGIAQTSGWKGDVGANVLPECCFPRFVPRWLEGLVPLAYQLDDKRLIDLSNQYMGYIMTVEDPAKVTPSTVAWGHLGRVLQGYYEATGDERAIKLCRRILEYTDNVKDVKSNAITSPARLGMLLGFSWWGYNKSGNEEILNIVERSTRKNVEDWKDYYINFKDKDVTAKANYLDKPEDMGRHGVDVAQAIQYPVSYYLMSKDESYVNSVFKGLDNMDEFDGQVNGRWTADEYLAGLKPTQGTELCVITESVYSLTKNFEALGDVSFADRMERMIFNAMPGTCTGDMWSHQYDQLANQISASNDKDRLYHKNSTDANVFGFSPQYACCLSNMHSAFPRYVENMWMASNDNGLVAATYGPCIVKAKVGNNIDATISEETNYPFSDVITFKVNPAQTTNFPIYFRIPSWAENAELTVAGKAIKNAKGTMCKVERAWKAGDVVTLKLNNKVRTEKHFNNSASVVWGSLDFVLKIGESYRKVSNKMDHPITPSYPTGVANWQIEPTTPWNYGLVIDRQNPKYSIEYKEISNVPFARKGEPVFLPNATDFITWEKDVPLVLKMKARRVDNWTMNGPVAGDVPLNPITTEEDTIVELIPYGCTRLRISEFPVIPSTKK